MIKFELMIEDREREGRPCIAFCVEPRMDATSSKSERLFWTFMDEGLKVTTNVIMRLLNDNRSVLVDMVDGSPEARKAFEETVKSLDKVYKRKGQSDE